MRETWQVCYLQSVVVHQRNFVDPDDSHVYTVLKTCGCELNASYDDSSARPASCSVRTYMSSCTETNFEDRTSLGQDMFQVFLQTVAESNAL